MKKAERAEKIRIILDRLYPAPKCSLNYGTPLEMLIATQLSAQCTDARVNMVTPLLFERFPTPAAFAASTPEEVEPYIRSCGLYKTKARDLVALSQQIIERFDGEIPKTLEDLVTLPGIGRKTANLVCGDVFHMPGAVVTDTHCIRIANRLGLCNTTDPRRVENALRELLPPDESNAFCHRIVLFGREFCIARSPQCETCPLNDICKTYRK